MPGSKRYYCKRQPSVGEVVTYHVEMDVLLSLMRTIVRVLALGNRSSLWKRVLEGATCLFHATRISCAHA